MLLISIPRLDAQNVKYPAGIEEKIRQVETNLSGWASVEGEKPWTIADRMKQLNINGLSIAVINDNQIEWLKTYGWADVTEKRPVTEKTLFQAASISKSLNGVGVLKLAQEGRIDLNTDINQYLTSWKFPYNGQYGTKQITLAALLSHTAGLTVHGFPGYETGDTIPTLPQILDGAAPANTRAVRSMSEPGKNYVYSGGGVTVSQLAVMDVTRLPYDVFMQKNVLDPMGMNSSFFMQPPPKSKKKMLATGYGADGKEIPGKYYIYPEQAAAGLWTNPADLCKYIIETQLSWKGMSGKVLTHEMTKLRLTPVLQESAYGVFVSRKNSSVYFSHSGGNEGFRSYYVGDLEEGVGMAIMVNSDNGSILEEIANSVATVYEWKDYNKPVIKKVVKVADTLLDKYVGKYKFGEETVIIKKEGRDLFINAFGDLFWKAYFTSDTDFFVMEYKADMKFQISSEGRVTGFFMGGMAIRKVE